VVLQVEHKHGNHVEEETDAAADAERVEADATVPLRALQIGCHVCDVKRRDTQVRYREEGHENEEALPLLLQAAAHCLYDLAESHCLPDNENREDQELNADDVVGRV
jgi:hypothetical protein